MESEIAHSLLGNSTDFLKKKMEAAIKHKLNTLHGDSGVNQDTEMQIPLYEIQNLQFMCNGGYAEVQAFVISYLCETNSWNPGLFRDL